jgi:hypothetical protein
VNEIVLSSWEGRFWAWLTDVLLIGIPWHIAVRVLKIDVLSLSGALLLIELLFIYWTALEGYRGQSFWKMLLNIAVTGPFGESIGFGDAAVECFGKAFLLPLDCLAGWILFREGKQRLFNRLSNTIVINQTE